MTYDRANLLVHADAAAIKVGVAGTPTRVRSHTTRGYELVAQWTGLGHATAVAAERAVVDSWRIAGVDPVAGAPLDGRTETAPATQLEATLAQLTELLGTADLREAPTVERRQVTTRPGPVAGRVR